MARTRIRLFSLLTASHPQPLEVLSGFKVPGQKPMDSMLAVLVARDSLNWVHSISGGWNRRLHCLDQSTRLNRPDSLGHQTGVVGIGCDLWTSCRRRCFGVISVRRLAPSLNRCTIFFLLFLFCWRRPQDAHSPFHRNLPDLAARHSLLLNRVKKQ